MGRLPIEDPHLIETLLGRLIEVIEQENEVLASGQPFTLNPFVDRKSVLLLQLGRAVATLDGADLSEVLGDQVAVLNEQLEKNKKLLSQHQRAVRELADIMVRVIQADCGDGSYDRSIAGSAAL